MAEISRGADTDLAQCLNDADLYCEEEWLRDVGACHRSGIDAAFEKRDDRPAEFRPKHPIELFDRAAESHVAAQCIAPHASRLRPVAREHEGEPTFPNPGTCDEERGRVVVE